MLSNNPIDQALMEARARILDEKKNQRAHKTDLLTEMKTKHEYLDRGKNLYEPYDGIACEGKLKVDAMYFSQLMKNLEKSHIPIVENLLISLFKDIRQIYEFINIKPEVFGKKITIDILSESQSEINRLLSNTIFESLDASFYRLSPEERSNKYKDKAEYIAKELVNEGADVEQALSFAIKTCVMEGMINKINFPFTCWTRVKYLTESQDYGLIFDQQELINLVESYEKKVRNISKVIATCV